MACGTGGDQGTGPPTSSPDSGSAPIEFVHVAAKILDIDGGAAIAGATICLVDHPAVPCATTDPDGNYTLALPAWTTDVDLAFTETAPGYLGLTGLVHENTRGVAWLSMPLWSDARAAAFMAQAGFTYPAMDKAFVLFYASVGRTVSMQPAPGEGPVYLDAAAGNPDPTLASTTSEGYGVFGAVEPGRIELTSSSTACVDGPLGTMAWPDPNPSTAAGVAVAGTMTEMVLPCN